MHWFLARRAKEEISCSECVATSCAFVLPSPVFRTHVVYTCCTVVAGVNSAVSVGPWAGNLNGGSSWLSVLYVVCDVDMEVRVM
jgi:hypothetical protein